MIVFVRHADDPQPSLPRGEWHSEIITEHRSASGFGYDPLFFVPEFGKTAAELDPAVKNSVSIARRRCNHCSPACAADPPRWPASFRLPRRQPSELPASSNSARSHRFPLHPHPVVAYRVPYCDFQLASRRRRDSRGRLHRGIDCRPRRALPLIWGRRVTTIFIGGGTLSLLSGEAVDALLTAVRTRVTLIPEAEITLEANPGTVEAGRFAAYREAGVSSSVTRVQSFNPAHLRYAAAFTMLARQGGRSRSPGVTLSVSTWI